MKLQGKGRVVAPLNLDLLSAQVSWNVHTAFSILPFWLKKLILRFYFLNQDSLANIPFWRKEYTRNPACLIKELNLVFPIHFQRLSRLNHYWFCKFHLSNCFTVLKFFLPFSPFNLPFSSVLVWGIERCCSMCGHPSSIHDHRKSFQKASMTLSSLMSSHQIWQILHSCEP